MYRFPPLESCHRATQPRFWPWHMLDHLSVAHELLATVPERWERPLGAPVALR